MKTFSDINIHELLLQQEPFIFIDVLTFCDEHVCESDFQVRTGHIYVENGQLKRCALAEIIAQTCAARQGYINKYILKKSIQIGFIGALRNFTILATPATGDTLHTRIEIQEEIMNITLVKAEITCGNQLIASGTLKMSTGEKEI